MAQPTPPQEPKEQSQEPRRLGGFELLGRLGKGGMGTVLKARQVSMDRLVALKILPQRLAKDEGFVQRFLREARSAARLRHPNIVQAFDVGFVDGYYFFAMEFVDGETLADLVRREGPLEPNRALDVMKQVTSALIAAHEAGIVHRDIKPANIMIDKKGEVRVTDFGLAKRTEGDVAVTADGAVVGTPSYVAPEMAKGGEAESRSDLYSLGATFFCALAGRPPFEGRNFSEVLVKQATEQAPPLAALAPRVDRRLCHIIDRLLRKNPEARFPSATALLDDLNGLGKLQSVAAAARAEGRAMLAEAPTLEMSAGKRREREASIEAQRPKSNRTTLIAVAAIVAILAIVGIVLATRRPKTSGLKPDEKGGPPPTTSTQIVTKVVVPPTSATKVGPVPPKKLTTAVSVTKKGPTIEPQPPVPKPGEWVDLFDGKSLDNWQVLEGESFKDRGKVHVQDGVLRLELGPGPRPITGIVYKGKVPTDNYEVEYEAMRTGGNLDFANLTFPVGEAICSLVVGGAVQGNLIGLQKVDGKEPWQTAGFKWRPFERGTWYRVRLRVAPDALTAWVDDEQQFAMPRAGHRFESFWVLAEAKPFGVVTYITAGAIRSLRLRRLDGAPTPEPRAADVAKWEAIKADARKLADAGKFDEAVKLLEGAKAVPLDGIAELVVEGIESIESIRSARLRAALAAYQAESDKLWALFKARDYAAADKLLPNLPKVANLREVTEADQEAAKLLKAFWAAVEKGVAARKGTISIEGALGNVTGVENGVITLQTAKGPVTRTTYQLTAKQALTYAAVVLKDDERSHLAEAIFRIAEAEDPALADKALAAAGNPPGLAVYKDRLAALTLGAAEVAARKAWAEIEALAKDKLTATTAKSLLALLDGFAAKHGNTKCFADRGGQIAASRDQAQQLLGGVGPGPKFFHVDPRRLPDGRVELSYDFSDPAQGQDFQRVDAREFRVEGNELWLGGSGGGSVAHVARFLGDLELTGSWRIVKHYAGSGYGAAEICRTDEQGYRLEFREKAQRLNGLGPERPLGAAEAACTSGEWHTLRFARSGAGLGAWFDDDGKIVANDRTARGGAVNLCYWKAQVRFRSLRIVGKLDPTWLTAHPDAARQLAAAPLAGEVPKPGEWQSLFDGKTLEGWRKYEAEGQNTGTLDVKAGQIVLGAGNPHAGLIWTQDFPTSDYELELKMSPLGGYNRPSMLTFPVGDAFCTLYYNGGTEAGLAKIGGKDFGVPGGKPGAEKHWYAVRLRVTKAKIQVWADAKPLLNVAIPEGAALTCEHPDWGIKRLHILTWKTSAAYRDLRVRRLGGE